MVSFSIFEGKAIVRQMKGSVTVGNIWEAIRRVRSSMSGDENGLTRVEMEFMGLQKEGKGPKGHSSIYKAAENAALSLPL